MKTYIHILTTTFLSFLVSFNAFAQIDTLCFGSSLETYSINPNLGSIYSWNVSGGGIIVGSETGTSIQVDWSSVPVGLINNAITLTEELNGCEAQQFLSVEIIDNPSPNLSVSNSSICLGDPVIISVDDGYNTYNWTPSVLSGVSNNYIPNDINDNIFQVEVIGEGGCSATESVEVVINELPNVEISLSESSICLGESITITATSGFTSYSWNNSSLSNNQTTFTPNLSDTQFSVIVSDENGCESSDIANLTINEITPIELLVNGSETTTICLGETISLDATDGFVDYEWVPAVIIGDNGDYIPQNTSEVTYTVTSTDSEGCQSVDTINITINNIPNPGPIIYN
tara:strand:+ start:4514 stop:5545 length:1032 start_codon:yes stop_codon:yes gene_type:complete